MQGMRGREFADCSVLFSSPVFLPSRPASFLAVGLRGRCTRRTNQQPFLPQFSVGQSRTELSVSVSHSLPHPCSVLSQVPQAALHRTCLHSGANFSTVAHSPPTCWCAPIFLLISASISAEKPASLLGQEGSRSVRETASPSYFPAQFFSLYDPRASHALQCKVVCDWPIPTHFLRFPLEQHPGPPSRSPFFCSWAWGGLTLDAALRSLRSPHPRLLIEPVLWAPSLLDFPLWPSSPSNSASPSSIT